MENNETVKSIIECAENLGWNVHTGMNDGRTVMFEFSKFTPAGQDFNFNLSLVNDSFYSFILDLKNYYEDFDPDTEAYLWLDDSGHGRNGAPYHMKDVLKDMEAAEAMIKELLDALIEVESVLSECC